MTTENEQPDDVDATDAPRAETVDGVGSEDSTADDVAALRAERDQHYERFLRSQAEFENFKRRVQKERSDDLRYADAGVVRELLPVIDNLERAVEAAGNEESPSNLTEGVGLVVKQLHDVLAGRGVKAIETAGTMFDPNLHEALQQIPSPEHPPMAVVQEVERGYVLHDRVLRPAKVIVSSGPPAGDVTA